MPPDARSARRAKHACAGVSGNPAHRLANSYAVLQRRRPVRETVTVHRTVGSSSSTPWPCIESRDAPVSEAERATSEDEDRSAKRPATSGEDEVSTTKSERNASSSRLEREAPRSSNDFSLSGFATRVNSRSCVQLMMADSKADRSRGNPSRTRIAWASSSRPRGEIPRRSRA